MSIGFETLVEAFIVPTVITNQPSVPYPDFRQPGPIDLTLGLDIYSNR